LSDDHAGVSLTQVGISDLKGEIDVLEERMESCGVNKTPNYKKKKPDLSRNMIEIERLKAVVRRLRKRIEENEHHSLYQDSRENDLENEVMRLERELEREKKRNKKLKRENDEFEQFVMRDRSRSRW